MPAAEVIARSIHASLRVRHVLGARACATEHARRGTAPSHRAAPARSLRSSPNLTQSSMITVQGTSVPWLTIDLFIPVPSSRCTTAMCPRASCPALGAHDAEDSTPDVASTLDYDVIAVSCAHRECHNTLPLMNGHVVAAGS